MSVSIITFANLGEKTNLKTAAIVPVVDIFARRSKLDKVICQIHSSFYFPNTYSATPTFVRYVVRICERVLGVSLRNIHQVLFDFFASRKLGDSDVYIFHGGYFMRRTLRASKKSGAISVNIATTADFRMNEVLEKEEMRLLGVDDSKGVYASLRESYGEGDAFDYLITYSDFAKSSYVKAGFPAERIFVAHSDITALSESRKNSTSVFTALYVAYTTPLKGLQYLLDAWESLNLKNAELVLVGGYGTMPEELIQRYNVRIAKNPSIRQVGNVAKPEEYYKEASVFVFPSLTEGNPKVVMEAMACGLPVITTENAQSIVEDGKTGFMVPIRDAQAIADKVKYLYEHRAVAEQMGREARKAIENKRPFGEAVYEIYSEILERERKYI